MTAVSSEGVILAGCFDDVAWIRVEGKGSCLNSGLLKEFARHSRGQGQNHFVIDLENCPAMDSTFMGTLAAIALDLKASDPDGSIEILNVNSRNEDCLSNLGLTCLLDIDLDGSSWKKERSQVAENLAKPLADLDMDQREKTELVMEAHEALVKANEENISQFRDVLEILRKELDGQDGDAPRG